MKRVLLVLLLVVSFGTVGTRAAEFQVAPFQAIVTIPVGHACMGGGIADAREIVDPLFAKGFTFLGAGEPVVVCAVDFCQLNNDAYDYWREALAKAAGTTRDRILLATVHQHDAPICDLRAQALLDEQGLKGSLCDVAFCKKAAGRTAAALAVALKSPRRVTDVGTGKARVEQLASNRRIAAPGAKVNWDRTSADKRYDDAPEGEIDPDVRTISLWDGERPVVAWSTYAIHPMSYYGRGQVSADFVGRARARREADDLEVAQIYFSGCAGDTTAGKYNNGLPEERRVLADRLYKGLAEAWTRTKRVPIDNVTFRSTPLLLPSRSGGDFDEETQRAILADPKKTRWQRNCAAMGLSWRERLLAKRPIDVGCLDFGAAQFMVMPAETFVGYQLAAQRMRPDSFVVVSGYGDGAPGYVPMAAHWKEGYDDSYSWVTPESPAALMGAMSKALGVEGR
jgi:hypothetical protein